MQKKTLFIALILVLVLLTIPTDAKKNNLKKKLKKLLNFNLKKKIARIEERISKNEKKINDLSDDSEDDSNGAEEEKCPPCPATITPFNATRYLGDWYQVSGLPAFFQPAGTSCIRATYGETGSPNNITVRNVAINPQNKFDEICGYALHPSGFIPDPNLHTGFLIVTFPPPAQPGDYHLLDTDYDNFASVWSCATFTIPGVGQMIEKNAWILVRDPANVSPEIMGKAFAAFTNEGLDVSGFKDVSQDGCTYQDPEGGAPCSGGAWNDGDWTPQG